MRVTRKGQVTIPQNVRRRLGIAAGSDVEFVFDEEGVLLRKVDPSKDSRSQEVGELMSHIREHRGSMKLSGLSPDEFYTILRD